MEQTISRRILIPGNMKYFVNSQAVFSLKTTGDGNTTATCIIKSGLKINLTVWNL